MRVPFTKQLILLLSTTIRNKCYEPLNGAFFFLLLKTMKNTIDYSKAPKDIQDALQEHDNLCEIHIYDDKEDKKIATKIEQLSAKIETWEETQKE